MTDKIKELFVLTKIFCSQANRAEEYEKEGPSQKATMQGKENEILNRLLKKENKLSKQIILLEAAEKLANKNRTLREAAEALDAAKTEEVYKIRDQIREELAICFMNAAMD